eukprot:1067274-Prymnesium_polylepis.2
MRADPTGAMSRVLVVCPAVPWHPSLPARVDCQAEPVHEPPRPTKGLRELASAGAALPQLGVLHVAQGGGL